MKKIIWMSIKLQIKQSWARETYRFCLVIQPMIYLIMMYALYQISGKQNFMTFVVLGTGMLTLWSTIAFSSAGDLDRERRMGTLKSIFAASTDFRVIVFSKVLGNTIFGCLPMLVIFVFTYLFRRSLFCVHNIVLFLLTFLISTFSFMGISLIFSAFFTLTRKTRLFMNCMEFPFYILCGFIVPVSDLPKYLRWLSYLLSPTWVNDILRSTIVGISDYALFGQKIAILVALTLIYYVAAYFLLGVMIKKVRRDATLEVY